MKYFKKIRIRLGDENCSSSHGVILSNVISINIFLLDVNFENLTIKFGFPIYTLHIYKTKVMLILELDIVRKVFRYVIIFCNF